MEQESILFTGRFIGDARTFIVPGGAGKSKPGLESWQILGRLDYNDFSGGGFSNKELRLTHSFGKSEVITDLGPRRAGGHGGADASLQDLIFRAQKDSDPLGLRAACAPAPFRV